MPKRGNCVYDKIANKKQMLTVKVRRCVTVSHRIAAQPELVQGQSGARPFGKPSVSNAVYRQRLLAAGWSGEWSAVQRAIPILSGAVAVIAN